MKYFILIKDGYIDAIGIGGGTEITEEKYAQIMEIIRNKPHKYGYDYRLREDMTWEEYELPEPEEDENIDPTEIAEALEEIV